MPPEVLIAYCTRCGSTAEVAEAMGETMRDAGVAVAVEPMEEVASISDDAFLILGAALYFGHFPRDFHKFAVRFEREISNARPWIFILGPTEKNPRHFSAAEEQARRELAKYPWLRPADVRVLGGKFDPHDLNLPFPLSLAMKIPGNPMRKVPPSDIRDWDWIRRWARAIADHLTAVV